MTKVWFRSMYKILDNNTILIGWNCLLYTITFMKWRIVDPRPSLEVAPESEYAIFCSLFFKNWGWLYSSKILIIFPFSYDNHGSTWPQLIFIINDKLNYISKQNRHSIIKLTVSFIRLDPNLKITRMTTKILTLWT